MMKRMHVLTLLITLCSTLSLFSHAFAPEEKKLNDQYQQWLKSEYAQQHEKLIPVVAVADMYFACNKKRKFEAITPTVKSLIIDLSREQLAQKLQGCLASDTVKSDTALNFGLQACFHEQLAHLSPQDKEEKMKLVNKAILSLSRAERQQSFTQCVTDQAIMYLK